MAEGKLKILCKQSDQRSSEKLKIKLKRAKESNFVLI